MSFKFVMLPPAGELLNTWAVRIRQAVPDIEVVVCNSRQEALRALPGARGALGTMDAQLLSAAPQLEWLACPAAGPAPSFYFPELVASRVQVTNMRGIYSDHISAHIMAFVLAFARGLHRFLPNQFQGKWDQGAGGVVHLPEATALIVGTGGIGGATARLCKAFGMRVIGIDPRCPSPPKGVDELHRPEALDGQLGRADFVILTAPQTPGTQGLIQRQQLGRMKKTAFLINIGAGSRSNWTIWPRPCTRASSAARPWMCSRSSRCPRDIRCGRRPIF